MADDELGALLEMVLKLTPAERHRLLREAEALIAARAASELDPALHPPLANDDPDGRSQVGPTPCPRCGLLPGPSEIFCSRCGNRVAF